MAGTRRTAGINTTEMQQKHRNWTEPHKRTVPDEADRCTGITSSGSQCKKAKVEGSEYCLFHQDKPVHTEADRPVDTIENLPAGVNEHCQDEFSLSKEERKQLGIKDNEQHCWIRDPRYWGNKVPGDSCREFVRNNAGGRVIMKDGEYVFNGVDLILAARPMSEVLKLRAREQAQADEIEKEKRRMFRDDRDINEEEKERLYARKYMNTEENVRAGMIGPQSPSSGMAYEDYVKNRGLSRTEIEREELSYSLGPRYYQQELNNEQARAAEGRQQPRGSDGKFYSLPPNVKPRNLMKQGDRT